MQGYHMEATAGKNTVQYSEADCAAAAVPGVVGNVQEHLSSLNAKHQQHIGSIEAIMQKANNVVAILFGHREADAMWKTSFGTPSEEPNSPPREMDHLFGAFFSGIDNLSSTSRQMANQLEAAHKMLDQLLERLR